MHATIGNDQPTYVYYVELCSPWIIAVLLCDSKLPAGEVALHVYSPASLNIIFVVTKETAALLCDIT